MHSRTSLLALSFWILSTFASHPLKAEELFVTGRPASPGFINSLFEENGWPSTVARPLFPGQSWTDGSNNRITNLDWEPPASGLAALSDHPEKVERVGGLFFGGLTLLRPLTFQYYHLGKLRGESPNLTLYLLNPGSKKARIHLRQGIGKPSLDYFSSGHTNNMEWFKTLEQNLGQFMTIEAGQSKAIFQQPLPPEYVVSGILGLTQVEGPPLQFTFVARKSLEEQISLNNLLKEDDVHSRGFYPLAVQKLERTFRIGQEPLTIAVGAVRQQTFSGVRELRGDYGVQYSLDLQVRNDTSQSAGLEFIFNPRGGPATGTFLIDGQFIEIGITKAFEEKIIHRVSLEPNESKNLKLHTIPEGASNYPVRIIIRESE